MSDRVGFEIDFLPVGNGERSGDAISIRYGSPGKYKVLVYDGGTKESGQALVDHIRTYYGTTFVDYVVNSHPDGDHASGLSVVLEQLNVGTLWMHRPWNHSKEIRNYFKDGRITDNSLAERLKEGMSAAYKLEEIANANDIPIIEPFSGAAVGPFVVMSPQKNWYVHDLIAEFQKSPAQKMEAFWESMLKGAQKKDADWILELWTGEETLRENIDAKAENESSVILLGVIAKHGIMLTGDAGIRALNAAISACESAKLSLPEFLNFCQMPHHGSRHNVSPSILDRLLGSRKPSNDGITTKTAFVSAANGSSTHPRSAVVNAFLRRGAKVIATPDSAKRFHCKMPPRCGWREAKSLAFSYAAEPWN